MKSDQISQAQFPRQKLELKYTFLFLFLGSYSSCYTLLLCKKVKNKRNCSAIKPVRVALKKRNIMSYQCFHLPLNTHFSFTFVSLFYLFKNLFSLTSSSINQSFAFVRLYDIVDSICTSIPQRYCRFSSRPLQ